MPPVLEEEVRALIALTDDVCKTSKEAADLAKKALDAASGQGDSLKTLGEKVAEFAQAQQQLEAKLNAADRKIIFPEYDPLRLKFDRSQRSFDRLMRTKPNATTRIGPLVEEVQRANVTASMVKMFAEFHSDRSLTWDELEAMEAKSESKPFRHFREITGHLIRALDTSTSGEGSDWTPTMMGTQIMEAAMVAMRAASLIPTIPLPSPTWDYPYKTTYPTAQRVTQATALSANPWATSGVTEGYGSNKPTAKTTFSAKKVRIAEFWSAEFDVDSIVAVIDLLISDFGIGLGMAREAGLFNGDTSSTHLDADTVGQGSSGTAPETVIDGLRNFYLGLSTVPAVDVTTTPTTKQILGAFAKMTKALMADIGNQYIFCSPLGSMHLYANDDVRKLSDLGPKAVIVSGQIAELLGRPIVISGQMKDNLDTTGKNVSGSVNDKTAIIGAHLGRWRWGTRPSSPMDNTRLPLTDQRLLVVHDRYDLQYVGASDDVPIVAIHGIPASIG